MNIRKPSGIGLVITLAIASAVISSLAVVAEDSQTSLATFDQQIAAVSWTALDRPLALTLSGPGNWQQSRILQPGDNFVLGAFDSEGAPLPDGPYRWELRDLESESAVDRQPGIATRAPSRPSTESGGFSLKAGAFVSDQITGGAGEADLESPAGPSPPRLAAKDVLFIDDVIISARGCVGNGCINGESFNGETLRLKNVNTRISFIDTSTGAFPTRDWQLVANDSTAGGSDRFSIEDLTAGRTPFTIEGNARANALYVEDGGSLGLGTSTPGRSVHAIRGDSPGLRLQQDTSMSFAAQTWDIVGNESNFYIGDVDAGTFVFRIRPDAPTSSLTIDDDGDVGVGVIDADAALHVNSTTTATDAAEILVRNTGANTAIRSMLRLENAGRPEIVLTNTSSGNEWKYTALDAGFQISKSGTGVAEMLLENDGDLVISGVVRASSDRNTKRAIVPVDPQAILEKVVQLPIATWNRKTDEPWVRSLGPMAQDFSQLFGLGPNHLTISALDVASAGLASVQALVQRVDEQAERIESLETMNRVLLERLEALLDEHEP